MYPFRVFETGNYSQWLKLWEQYLLFYKTELADEITQVVWQRIISREVQSIGVFNGDELIGFMHFHSQINTWKIGKVYYLEDLFVSQNYRLQGIGRRLIEYLYDLARQNGYERVYWLTDKNNLPAQNLYGKLAEKTDFLLYRQEF